LLKSILYPFKFQIIFILTELLIIADDLTGAIETGVQLSKQDISSKVILNADSALGSILKDIQTTVVVINIESRHLQPAEAAKRVTQVLKIAQEVGINLFYKKTDSTLRGNVGAELEAFLHGTNQVTLPFIPALPRLKRFTRDGFQYIGETLLHHTIFAQDPLEPITNSFVSEIIKKQTDIEICISKCEGIPNLASSDSLNKKIIVFDCESGTDLKIIGKYLLKNGWQKAMAGTAAMVELLPELMKLSSSEANYNNPKGPLLLINGSLNDISLQQVLYANNLGITTLALNQQILKDSNFKENTDYKQISRKIKEEFENGGDVILNTSSLDRQVGNQNLDKENLGKEYFKSVSALIGELVLDILNEVNFTSLCVFGGDTLTGIIDLMGCKTIEPQSEIFPGVALASVQSKFGKIHLISKPGGYGQNELIWQIINHIKILNK
jgi:D-threonate/D-erythronate kinase